MIENNLKPLDVFFTRVNILKFMFTLKKVDGKFGLSKPANSK